ncbi:hypothetical protein J3R30DRAFT_3462242 [Lentinula aciculospora]|uniref:Uncharacterized protein n=1 Tax=Lentinula aciculospora TaxID=153920 RepID=A0A9W9AEH0_9AGAR|nr:hypothetical protein J3R30DRAFT_3462242 [Lentinula aciculospora]
MSTSTLSQILSSASYHLSLLRALESLQYAPSALNQQSKYLHDLQAELATVKEGVKQLGEKTKKERKEHEELRDSTTRRLAARLKGKAGLEKLEARKEKEEREYVGALENEMRERGKQTMLENMIEEARKVKTDLEEKSNRLGSTKEELSNLYHQVFDGPTAEFPRDDVLERELASAQATYDRVQAILNSHSQAVNLLSQADKMLGMSLKNIDEALGYSTWDIYGGGSISDMMERDALANSTVYAAKAEMLVNQAQNTSSDVQAIGPLRVHDISLFGDVFFDNVFSDIRAHHKIQNNREVLAAAHKRLKGQLRAARQRSQLAGADIIEASEVLAECNKELERYRREVFLRISRGENPEPTSSGPPGQRSESIGDRNVVASPLSYGETSNTVHISSDTLVARSDNPQLTNVPNVPSTTSSPLSSSSPSGFPTRYAPPPGPPPSGPPTRLGRIMSASMRIPEPSFQSAAALNQLRTSPVSPTTSRTVSLHPDSSRVPHSQIESGLVFPPSHRRSKSSDPASASASGRETGLLSAPSVAGTTATRGHRRSRSSVSSSRSTSISLASQRPLGTKQDSIRDPSPSGTPLPSLVSIDSGVTSAQGAAEGVSSPLKISSRSPSPDTSIPAHWGSSECSIFHFVTQQSSSRFHWYLSRKSLRSYDAGMNTNVQIV